MTITIPVLVPPMPALLFLFPQIRTLKICVLPIACCLLSSPASSELIEASFSVSLPIPCELEARVEAVKGTRASGEVLYVGGASGINALLQSDGLWTVIVASNLDPPTAEQTGVAIMNELHR